MKQFEYMGKYFQVFNEKEGAQALSNVKYMKKVLSLKYMNCQTIGDLYDKAALTAHINYINTRENTPVVMITKAVSEFEEHFDKELKNKYYMVMYRARKITRKNEIEMVAVFIPLFTIIDTRQLNI